MQWNAFKLGFLPLKRQSFSWKLSLNSCLIGFDQFYTGHAGGSSRAKALTKILSHRSLCVINTWRSGNEMPQCVGGPEFDSKWNLFSFSFVYFFFLFACILLVIVVLFVSLYSVSFFKNVQIFVPVALFLLSSYFFLFPRTASWGPAIHVFLVTGNIYFLQLVLALKSVYFWGF